MAERRPFWEADEVVAPAAPASQKPQRFYEADAVVGARPYSGSILPLSKDAQGKVSFDSDAGIVGMVKRAVGLPGRVYNQKPDMFTEQGVQNYMRNEGEILDSANDLAGLASPMNPGVRSGDFVIPGVKSSAQMAKVAPPSSRQLRQASDEAFENVRNSGVDYNAQAVAAMARDVKLALERDGILANGAPKTHSYLDDLANPPEGAVAPISHLMAARYAARNARKDFANPTEQLAGRRMVDSLDKFMGSDNPNAVVAGPAAAAAREFRDANANYAASKRSETLSGAETRAELRAAATNSGANLDNAIRSRAEAIYNSDKLSAGFNEAEMKAIEEVVRGTATRNTLRKVGNLLGGGGGLGMGLTAGGAGAMVGSMFGPVAGAAAGAGVAGTGMAAKQGGAALTRRAFQNVDEMTRMRSPLFEQMQARAGGAPEARMIQFDAIRRGITSDAPEAAYEGMLDALRRALEAGQ